MNELPDPLDPAESESLFGDVPADESASASCPHCGEVVEIALDPTGGLEQVYVEDCPVCCRPWTVRVSYFDGEATVDIQADDV